MGTGASKSKEVGVDLNPRVRYAGNLAKQEGQDKFIDAPVLVKLEHGTVRYRFQKDNRADAHIRMDDTDKPHEGPERSHKTGYFFHATLNDFSKDAAYDKEQDWKFRYVYQGAKSANQKKLFYVFGKGLNSQDRGIIRGEEARPQGVGYSWQNTHKVHGHVYYNLKFLPYDEVQDTIINSIPDLGDNSFEMTPTETELQVESGDRVETLMQTLSVQVLKPAVHIHIFHEGKQLEPSDILGNLRSEKEKTHNRFRVALMPK